MSHPHNLNDDHFDPCMMCRKEGTAYCKNQCPASYHEPELCEKCLEPVDECMCAEIDAQERIERLSQPVHIPSIIPSEIMQAAGRIEFAGMRIKEIAKTL